MLTGPITYYIGSTANLEKRVKRHNQGKAGSYTAKRRPVQLVHHEKFKNLDEAVNRERQIKGWSRAKKKALINNDFETLKELSKGS